MKTFHPAGTLPRFYLPPEACTGRVLTLTEREAHHGLRVLRLQRGDADTVLDGAGHEYECEVSEATRGQVLLTVRHKHARPPLPHRLTLLQALPKTKAFEFIVQKATELGASRIVPLLTERVVSQPEATAAAHKLDKWRWIAIDSIKQCGSAWLPAIEAPMPLAALLSRNDSCDLRLVGALHGERRHPRQILAEYRRVHERPPQSIGIFVGPEGDFTPAEMEAIEQSGARRITLGPQVLRSDTAAIYCLSVLSYELQFPHSP